MSFWRMDDPVVEDGRVVVGGMWPSQRKIWQSTAFIKAFVGGYGSGKTTIAAKRAIAMALHNAPSPYMVVSPSYRFAKRTIIPAINNLLKGRRVNYTFNRQDFEYVIRYKGREAIIWIGSGDYPDSLKGPNICGACIDEPFIQPREVFDQMMARVRDPRARYRDIWLTGTPEDLNWGYDICAGQDAKKYDIELVQVSTRENKALPPEFVKTLESAYDPKMVKAYLDGEFVQLSKGQVYYAFDKTEHVKDLPRPNDIEYLCVGNDFNVNPMAAIIFWIHGDHMHVEDEVVLEGESDTLEMVHEVWRKSGGLVDKFYPDPSGMQRRTSAIGGITDLKIIRDAGIDLRGEPFDVLVRRRTPPKRDRFNAVNNMFRKGKLTISPRCDKLINAMMKLTYENMNTGDEHIADALGYPVEYEFSIMGEINRQRKWYR